ncbi:MAG: di-trans,poly-cis-decaprenylcistransferase [Ruminococcaceae bacterium]|nr:di-trans,poly-cis-decaprenylcistransferase [Oscillospiraceae bacterium]
MDGNGRWAKSRLMPRLAGHKEGVENFKRIAEYLIELDIEVATFYAFSTENWKRPQDEVENIMSLLVEYLEKWLAQNNEKNMRFRFIGDRRAFSPRIQALMDEVEKKSSHFRNQLNLALNYGSRDELARAFRLLAEEGKKDITPEDISSHLYTVGQPDVDLIIRTGGEIRLSNFLLYQSAYAEFYFSDKLWPDFSSEDLDDAIAYFNHRERRFGGVIERKP